MPPENPVTIVQKAGQPLLDELTVKLAREGDVAVKSVPAWRKAAVTPLTIDPVGAALIGINNFSVICTVVVPSKVPTPPHPAS